MTFSGVECSDCGRPIGRNHPSGHDPRCPTMLLAMVERWEADAEVIEGADQNVRGKHLPRVRRMIVAEAIRACARELRELAPTALHGGGDAYAVRRCAGQREIGGRWVQCVLYLGHIRDGSACVWGFDNQVTEARPFA